MQTSKPDIRPSYFCVKKKIFISKRYSLISLFLKSYETFIDDMISCLF